MQCALGLFFTFQTLFQTILSHNTDFEIIIWFTYFQLFAFRIVILFDELANLNLTKPNLHYPLLIQNL